MSGIGCAGLISGTGFCGIIIIGSSGLPGISGIAGGISRSLGITGISGEVFVGSITILVILFDNVTKSMPMPGSEKAYLGSPDNPKTAAVVCYITVIGWVIAYFAIYKNNKTAIAAYHLRQALLLHILLFIINGLGYWMTNGVTIVFDTLLFILWVWGFINAIYQRRKPVPIIGKFAEAWFANI